MAAQIKYWEGGGRADSEKGQMMKNLAAHLKELSGVDRKAFIAEWYARCGPKGDLTGFMETALVSRSKSTKKQLHGEWTP
eukprot:1467043-Amphidinium_carterae.1